MEEEGEGKWEGDFILCPMLCIALDRQQARLRTKMLHNIFSVKNQKPALNKHRHE